MERTRLPEDRRRSKGIRHLVAAGLTLSMGYVSGLSMLGGCGGTQAGVAPPTDGRLPESVVEKLTDCGKRGPVALQPQKHTVSFDVFMDSDGQVEQVALRDSTFHLDEVEACMADALQALSERAFEASLRRRAPASPAPLAPESRALFGHPLVLAAGGAEVVLVVGLMVVTVIVYYQVVRNTKTHRPPPPAPVVEDPPEPAKPEPKTAGDPKTTDPPPPPSDPPEKPRPKPRCEEVFEEVVNCFYIQQPKYATREKARDAASENLKKGPPKLPFTTRGKQDANKRPGVDHTTYYSADRRVKITIGCYELCCKNTNDGPVLVEGTQCYEHNTEDYR